MLAQSMTKGGTGAGRQFLEVRDNDCGDDARAGRWMQAAMVGGAAGLAPAVVGLVGPVGPGGLPDFLPGT